MSPREFRYFISGRIEIPDLVEFSRNKYSFFDLLLPFLHRKKFATVLFSRFNT
jgi:hypothetical protein